MKYFVSDFSLGIFHSSVGIGLLTSLCKAGEMEKEEADLVHFEGPFGQRLSYVMHTKNKESTGNVIWESVRALLFSDIFYYDY